MALVKKKSSLIGYGELVLFKNLINRINQEFASNRKYKNSLNTISITAQNGTESAYDVRIDTKYYTHECELHLVSSESEFSAKLAEKSDAALHEIEGLIVLLADGGALKFPKAIQLDKYQDTNLGRLSILIHVGLVDSATKKEAKNEISKLNEDFYEFELTSLNEDSIPIEIKEKNDDDSDEEDDEFSVLDELINCLFVHDWINMVRKTEKESSLRFKSGNLYYRVQIEPFPLILLKYLYNLLESNGGECQLATDNTEEAKTNNSDDENEFSVESLIANLSELRSKASHMNFEDRKLFAEKVVTNFWKSIGGDANELLNLDDDDADNVE